MPAGLGRKLGDHVIPVLDEVSALFYQQVRPPTELRGDIARDGENLASLVDGELGGDGGTGVLRAFHHQNTQAHAADDAVADGKVLGKSGRAHGEFGDQQAAGGEIGGDLLVLDRVDDVDTAAQDSDRVEIG